MALNVPPITTRHRDLNYLPLVDKNFQIKDLETDNNSLKVFCQCQDNYMNGSDTIGLWESNIPRYIVPSVHIFHDIIHQYQAIYNPTLRAIMSPSQTILFTITADSINEMLQFQPGQNLTPIFLGELLENSTKMSSSELNRLCHTFIDKDHIPKILLPI